MKSKKKISFLVLLFIVAISTFTAALVACGNNFNPDKNPEMGEYYTEVMDEEYLLELQGKTFVLSMGEEIKAGTYSLKNNELSFKFAGSKETATGVYETTVITMQYNGNAYRFLKKVEFDVIFDVDGGNAMPAVKVLNGKKLAKPQDPTKSGYGFVGWYTDKTYSTAFDFDTQIITGPTVLYARFEKVAAGQLDFTVKFLDGSEELFAAKKTVGGIVYDLPTPQKAGSTFVGWWVSDYQDAEKLTYKYTDQVLDANTNLYAVWQSDFPAVSVTSTGASWSAKGTNNSYTIKITAPDGTDTGDINSSKTTYDYDFASRAEGDYKIEVTLNGNTTTAYYKNKALARVSLFTVAEGDVLNYNAVANAEKYYITVECGDENHKHTYVDNGTSTNYNFASCTMKKGGIKFTVYAEGAGFALSKSEVFSFSRDLAALAGLTYDKSTDRIYWKTVPDATGYVVTVDNGSEDKAVVNVGNVNTFSLNQYTGGLKISVVATANGYNSSAAAELELTKSALVTPSNIRVANNTVKWNAVIGAEKYVVKFNGKTYETTSAEWTIEESYFNGASACSLSVQAVSSDAENNSSFSDEVTVEKAPATIGGVAYALGKLNWNGVYGAATYQIKVNDGEPYNVTDGELSAVIKLTKAGENTISVRWVSEQGASSDWATVKVTARTITFDTQGGAAVAPMYVVVGDPLNMPATSYTGYDFAGWYSAANSNGKKFDEAFFTSNEDVLLYAYYTPKTFTVTFSVEDGETVSMESMQVKYKQEFELPVAQSNDSVRFFAGWTTEPNGAGILITGEDGKGLDTFRLTADTTLYASWVTVLSYEKITYEGQEAYSVKKGEAINRVTEVTVPQYYNGLPVTTVEGSAFKGCYYLEVVNIPNTIRSISGLNLGGNAAGSPFESCSKLREVNIIPVEGNHEVFYKSIDGVLFFNNTVGGNGVELKYYPYAKEDTTYAIPFGVQTLPTGVLKNCKIEHLFIPATVSKIDSEAVASSYYLLDVKFEDMPETPEYQIWFEEIPTETTEKQLTIGKNVFKSDSKLTEINLPSRVVNLDFTAFQSCSKLENVNIQGEGGQYTSKDGTICNANGTTLLYCPSGKTGTFEIPAGVSKIADYAFTYNSSTTALASYRGVSISKLIVPAYVTEIGKGAFCSLSNLTEIEFQGDEESPDLTIKEEAFLGCNNKEFTSVTLPANLKVLGKNAFGCSYLLYVRVNTVGRLVNADTNTYDVNFATNAFANAYGNSVVTNVWLGDGVPVIDIAGVFGLKLKSVEIDENNPYYYAEEGVVFNKDVTEILYYPTEKTGNYTIPDTITRIGAYVFKNKTGIEQITIHSNIVEIGESAFEGCSNLTTVIFSELEGPAPDVTDPDTPAPANEEGTGGDETTDPETPTTGDEEPEEKVLVFEINVFKNCTKLTSISLPTTVKAISEGMFYGCSKLESVTIPNTVETIGSDAFRSCSALESLTIPEGVKEIGDGVFLSCDKLTELALPASLQKIGGYDEAGNRTSFNVFGASASYSTNKSELKTITVPEESLYYVVIEGVLYAKDTQTGNPAELLLCPFKNDAAATDNVVTIPNTVTKIWDRAFSYNDGVKEVKFQDPEEGQEIPEDLLGAEVFSYSKQIATITLAKGTKTIGKNMFKNCTGLQTVYIPNTVTKMEGGAFIACGNLENVIFEDGGTEGLVFVGEKLRYTSDRASSDYYLSVFANCSKLKKICIPARTTEIGNYAFTSFTFDTGYGYREGYNSYFDEVTFELNEDSVTSSFNLKIGDSAFMGNPLRFNQSSSATTFVFPENLTEIGVQAFRGNSESDAILVGVDFSNCTALSTIGNYAFQYTKLTNVTLPASLTTLGTYTFANIKTELSVTFDDSTTITEFPNNLFYNSNLSSITLPDTLETIGTSCFYSTKISSITIPATVTTIGATAFNWCSQLTSVTFDTFTEGDDAGKTSITNIGKQAFQSTGLTSFSFPVSKATAMTCGEQLFASCKKLTQVYVSESVGAGLDKILQKANSLTKVTVSADSQNYSADATQPIIYNKAGLSVLFIYGKLSGAFIVPDGATEIGEGAFRNQVEITSVSLPASIVTLGKQAFMNCHKLETVTFRTDTDGTSKLTTLGESVFERCLKLKSIVIPEGSGTYKVTELPKAAFEECRSLESVVLPDSINKFNDQVFNYCISLKKLDTHATSAESANLQSSFNLPTDLNYMGTYSFRATAFTSVHIPAKIRASVFTASTKDTSKKWGLCNYMFQYCKNLTTVTFGNDISSLTEGEKTNYNFNLGTYVFEGTALQSITLPDTLVAIGNYAFKNCKKLASIELPENAKLTTTGANTFEGCSALTKVTLPENVITVGGSAFKDCTQLSEIDLTKVQTVSSNAFENCYGLTSVHLKAAKSTSGVSSKAFLNCKNLSEVSFEDNAVLTKICESAFQGCVKLTKVDLPAKVNYVDKYAFSGTAIEEIDLSNVASLYAYAFSDCTKLSKVTLRTANTSIYEGVFMNCTALKSITLSDKVTTINTKAFYNTGLEKVNIPKAVKNIYSEAFGNCANLKEFTVDSNNTTFEVNYGGALVKKADGSIYCFPAGKKASDVAAVPENTAAFSGGWAGVNGAVNMEIPQGKTTIAAGEYRDYKSLVSVVIPDSVTTINANAFDGCPNLESVTFSGTPTIKTIGNYAFANCPKLTTVVLPDSLTSMGTYLFQNSGITSITIPEGITEIGNYDFDGCAKLASVVLPSGLVKSGTYTFQNCVSLKSVTYTGYEGTAKFALPDTLTTLGNYAFYGSGLEEVNLPTDRALSIGSYMFAKTPCLKELVLPDIYTTMPAGFMMDSTGIEKVVLPETVTAISANAFNGCVNLKEINIPDSVVTLNMKSFANCTSIPSIHIKSGVSIKGGTFLNWTAKQTIYIEDSEYDIMFSDWSLVSNSSTLAYYTDTDYKGAFDIWNTGCFANIVYEYTPEQA